MVTSLVKSIVSGGVSKSSMGVLVDVDGTRATFPEVDVMVGTDVAVAETGTGMEVLAGNGSRCRRRGRHGSFDFGVGQSVIGSFDALVRLSAGRANQRFEFVGMLFGTQVTSSPGRLCIELLLDRSVLSLLNTLLLL